jgi:translation initiation factor 4A
MSTHFEEFKNWDDIETISANVLRGIYAHGFEKPSPIQQKAILPMTTPREIKKGDETIVRRPDIIAQAQSGTGKTGCFTVSTLSIIDETIDKTQAIILAHTHELASQIMDVFSSISTFTKIRIQKLVGGTPVDDDKNALDALTPHIIVGTPGRVHDLIRRRYVKTDDVGLIILDEADEMLTEGFKDQIYKIFQFMPNMIQIALFSATMPPELKALTTSFMEDPISILVKAEALTLQGIAQWLIRLENDEQKYLTLKDIYSGLTFSQTIIYCNSTKRVDDLHEAMLADGFSVGKIHGKMDELERKEVNKDFRSGKVRVLITSDLFARGIDIQQVSTVINFDMPKSEHTYIHRIGRSGRFGRKGVAINFSTKHDAGKIKRFEEYYNTQIIEMPGDWKTRIN